MKDCAIDLIGDYFPPFLSQVFRHRTLFRYLVRQQTADRAELMLIFSSFMRILQGLRAVV